MSNHTINFMSPSLIAFTAEIQEKVQQGYEIDFANDPPTMWFHNYRTGMVHKGNVARDYAIELEKLEQEETHLANKTTLSLLVAAEEPAKRGRPAKASA